MLTEYATYLSNVITAAASVGSMLAVAWSLRSLSQQVRAAIRQAELSAESTRVASYFSLAQLFVNMDQFFADRPDLRARIYGPYQETYSAEDLKQQRTEAAAEMILDVVDAGIGNIIHLSDNASVQIWEAWFKHYASQAATREYWESHRHWYGQETVEFVDRVMRATSVAHDSGGEVRQDKSAASNGLETESTTHVSG